MTTTQENIYNWFWNNKMVKLATQQVDGIIESFQDGKTNQLISEMKTEINSWTGVELKCYEIRQLENMIPL